MQWARRGGWLLAAAVFAVALALRWPLLDAPPYGDEGLHYWTARHLGTDHDPITDLWGHNQAAPEHLLWQRPAYYLALAIPAQAGFDGFRLAAATLGALLAPTGYGLLRAHGASRTAATLAGVALGAVPMLMGWSSLGLMDAPMTALLLGMLWARAAGRHGLQAMLGIAAAWTKETALLALAALAAYEAAVGLRDRHLQLWPLRLTTRAAAPVFGLLLGPLPVMAFLFTDAPRIGNYGRESLAGVLDGAAVTPWLLPVLAAGLAQARSRFLAGAALASVLLVLALHLEGHYIAAWYLVPSCALTVVGSAAAADAWVRSAAHARLARRAAATVPAILAAGLVACVALVPLAERGWLAPLSGNAGDSLPGTWDYATRIRDADLEEAAAAVPLGDDTDVLAIDIYPPRLYVSVMERTRSTQLDWSFARSIYPFDVEPLALRIEEGSVWTLVEHLPNPMNEAIRSVYADCATLQTGRYTVIQGSPCAGRAAQLEQAWRERDPTF